MESTDGASVAAANPPFFNIQLMNLRLSQQMALVSLPQTPPVFLQYSIDS